MNKPPPAVIVISLVYIATGAVGLVSHWVESRGQPFQYDILWISLVSLIALVCGIFILRASDLARWGALAWIAFHVVLSAFHSWVQFAVHSLFCAAIAYLLFRPSSTLYFRTKT